MNGKSICFLVLAIGFFAFYQQSPVFTIGVIFILIIGYVAYKRKKKGKFKQSFSYNGRGKKGSYDQLMSLMMVQQFLNDTDSNHGPSNSSKGEPKEEDPADDGFDIKGMILDLLREG
jgi:hypothetical protein